MGEIASALDSLRDTIVKEVTAALKNTAQKTSYTTVWRDYEDLALDAFCRIVTNHIPSLSAKNFNRGQTGQEKNRLADLEITRDAERIAIAVKAARGSKDPANDLGTFNIYPKKKRTFSASFDLWIRYDDSNPNLITIDRIFFDRSYNFVGKSTLCAGVTYRKKDGNMRPKPWQMFEAGGSYWTSEAKFESAVETAMKYRANSLVEEHLENMTEEDQRLLYERLKKKFGGESKSPTT